MTRDREMLRALLLGVVAGARAITPLAAVADAARRGALPRDSVAASLLGAPAAAAGLKLFAAGEMMGDKLPSAPDRIVPAGMAARIATGALGGAALAPKGSRGLAALLGIVGAVGAAHLTFRARIWAMLRYGQTTTGLIEDALVLAATQYVMADVSRKR